MNVNPILPISGVNNELIRVLNDRFRQLSGGGGEPGPPGRPGTPGGGGGGGPDDDSAPTISVSADTVLTAMSQTVEIDTTAGPVTVTMPAFGDWIGLDIVFKLVTRGTADTPPGNDATIAAASGETFDSVPSTVLNTRWQSLTIRSVDVGLGIKWSAAVTVTATGAIPPGDVTLGTPSAPVYAGTDLNLRRLVRITIPFDPPGPLGTWDHITAFLFAPDDDAGLSKAIVQIPVGSDGFFIGVTGGAGVDASTLAPNASPVPFGPFHASEPIIVIEYPAPTETQKWRVYAVSGSTEIENSLKKTDDASPSPNVAFNVDPAPTGEVGEEYCPLAASFTPIDPDDFPHYERLASAAQTWGFNVQWTDKLDDPRWPLLGGYDIVIEYPSGNRSLQSSPPKQVSEDHSDLWPVVNGKYHFKLWLVSWDIFKNRNSIVEGVTPMLEFDVEAQDGVVGAMPLQDVTSFSVTFYFTDVDGNGKPALVLIPHFTPPDDPSWSSIFFYANIPRYGWVLLGYPSTGGPVDQTAWEDLPAADEDWEFLAIARDAADKDRDGNVSPDPTAPPSGTPAVTVHITKQPVGPPGIEYAPLVTGLDLVGSIPVFDISVDGVERWGLNAVWTPPDTDVYPNYGGVKMVLRPSTGSDIVLSYLGPTDAVMMTDMWPIGASQSYFLYAVSMDPYDRENTLIPGITPRVGPFLINNQTSGRLRANRNDPATLAANLAINLSLLGVAPGSIDNQELTAGAILVGGGGAKVIRFSVFDHSGVAIGWIGDDTVNSGFVGAWFRQLYVGGSGPAGAPFTVDAFGRLSINMNSANTGSVPFQLNLNGFTTQINNIGSTACIKIFANATPNLSTTIFPGGLNVFAATGSAAGILNSTGIGFQDSSATTRFNVNGTAGQVDVVAFGGNHITIGGSGAQGIQINGQQVLKQRQFGPGAVPTFTSFFDVQIWCQNLYAALSPATGHGLIS